MGSVLKTLKHAVFTLTSALILFSLTHKNSYFNAVVFRVSSSLTLQLKRL